jgi:hypothetical protein
MDVHLHSLANTLHKANRAKLLLRQDKLLNAKIPHPLNNHLRLSLSQRQLKLHHIAIVFTSLYITARKALRHIGVPF